MQSISKELSNIADSPVRKRNTFDESLSFEILPMPAEEIKPPTSSEALRDLWIEQAIRNIQREERRAKRAQDHAQYHKALKWTCDDVGIKTYNRVTEGLKLPYKDFLTTPEVLKHIFYAIISNPLTIWPPPKLKDNKQNATTEELARKWIEAATSELKSEYKRAEGESFQPDELTALYRASDNVGIFIDMKTLKQEVDIPYNLIDPSSLRSVFDDIITNP